MSVPQAAAICDTLTDAGLSTGAVRTWFNAPRGELGGLSPTAALRLGATLDGEPAGQPVLELARRDVTEGHWAGEAA